MAVLVQSLKAIVKLPVTSVGFGTDFKRRYYIVLRFRVDPEAALHTELQLISVISVSQIEERKSCR